MFTIVIVLSLAALIIAILSAIKPVPLWVAVVLLAIVALIEHIPVR
jgi:membrane protein implicated in regulation of membrane protease activity